MSAPKLPPSTPASGDTPRLRWDVVRRYGKGAFVAFIATSVVTSFYRQYQSFKEFVTLPAAFILELDLERNALVESSATSPLGMLKAASGRQIELHKLIKVLQRAKEDERVKGLLAILGDRANFGGMGQLQELRNALLDFRFHVQGRAPVFAYSNSFCEGGANGTGLYYLASAADKVFMPPTGMLSLLGFASSQVFVKGLLDRLKVQPEVFRREEYKAALAPLTGTGFDPAHKENLQSLLGSLYSQVVEGIASARRLAPSAVEAAVEASPLLPSQAMQLKLLDALAYRDQVEAQLMQHLPAEVQQAAQQPLQRPRGVSIAAAFRSQQLAGPRVTLQRYRLADQWAKSYQEFWGQGSSSSSGSKSGGGSSGNRGGVQQQQQQQQQQQEGQAAKAASLAATPEPASVASAIVQGVLGSQQGVGGAAPQSSSSSSSKRPIRPEDRPIVAVVTANGPIMQSEPGGVEAGEGVVESHKVVRVLRRYREHPQVKAVVLRINSPGGSAVASDMIAREVQLLRDAGKPVIACMGDVAASGGYFIAAPCNKVLAQPGTITGSIGVIFMKLNAKEALQEYGITGDTISFGANADWASPLQPLTPKQQQQIDGMISSTYEDFLSVVAKGRGMSKEAVRAVAKGRVWSGAQAMEVGLVDEVGGLVRAVDLAKELARLSLKPDDTNVVGWPSSNVPPALAALLQGSDGTDTPMSDSATAATATAATPWASCAPAAVQDLAARASAATELMSMFWTHGLKPNLFWQQQEQQQQQLLEHVAAAGGRYHQQQQLLAHPTGAAAAAAAAGVSGLQQQVVSLLGYLAQQHNQPEMYCLDAESLSRSCW